MTTGGAVPTTQACPGCNALVYYEGHSELQTSLVPHRFHCHRCGRVYVVRSTSHKPPKFALTPRHEVQQTEAEALGVDADHDHDHEHSEAAGDADHDHDHER